MEWVVVTVIVALVGLFKMVASPVIDLTRTITKLINTVECLSLDLAEAMTRNHESHGRLWAHSKEQDATLNDHTIRLTKLEANENDK